MAHGLGKVRMENMFKYDKKLAYPINITKKDLKMAKYLIICCLCLMVLPSGFEPTPKGSHSFADWGLKPLDYFRIKNRIY